MAYAIVTEIYYDGAWHDISADVRNRDPVTITRGRLDESSRTEPGSMTFTLNNGRSRINDVVGRYSPRNPSSDLFGLIGRNTPVRQSVDGMRRFDGEVSEWPIRWGLDDEDVTVTIQAFGILRRLGQGGGTGVRTPFARQIELLGPEAYWPLDSKGPETPIVGASAVGGSPFLLSSSSVGLTVGSGELSPWAGTGLLVGPGGSADPAVTSQITGNFMADVSMAAPVGDYEWCFDFLVRFSDGTAPVGDEAGAESTVNLSWYLTGNGSPRLDWQILFSTDFADTTGITVLAIDGATSAILDTAGFIGPHLADGELHHVSLGVARGSTAYTWSAFVDGDGVSGQSWTGSGTHPAQGVAHVNFNYEGRAPRPAPVTLGQMAIRSGAFTGSVATLPALTEEAGRGHYLEPAGRRIERMCAEDGIPFRAVGNLDDTELLGHQYDAPFLELLEQAAETDGGILHEDRSPVNILAIDGTFEDGTITGWQGSDAAVADSTVQAHTGTHSLKVTSTIDTGFIVALTNFASATEVNEGEQVNASCRVRAFGENLTNGFVWLQFLDEANVQVGTASGTAEFLWNGLWTLLSCSAVAPAGTAKCRFRVRGTVAAGFGIGTGFYLDDVVMAWGDTLVDPTAPAGLVYVTRSNLYNRPPILQLDYAGNAGKGGHVSILDPVDDDQAVVNDVTCQRPNGGSRRVVKLGGPLCSEPPPVGVGRYDKSADRNVPEDARLQVHAEAIVNQGTIDETRFPRVGFRPRKFPELTQRAAAIESGDLVTIDNPPAWLPPGSIGAIVTGYTERYSITDWEVEWASIPAELYTVGTLDVDRVDTERAFVGESFDAGTDTALVVDWEDQPFVAGGGLESIRDGSAVPLTYVPPPTGAIYMATNGSDANDGLSAAAPKLTINAAIAAAPAGGTIVMRGGVYRDWYHDGTSSTAGILAKALTIQAYPGEEPWLDGSDVVTGWAKPALHFDGTFESGIGNWTNGTAGVTVVQAADRVQTGTASLKATRTGAAGVIDFVSHLAASQPMMPVVPGDRLTVTASLNHDDTVARALFVRLRYYSGTTFLSENESSLSCSPNTWTNVSHTGTVPATADGVQVRIRTSASLATGKSVWADDITLSTYWRVSWNTPTFSGGNYYNNPPDAQPAVGYDTVNPEVVDPAYPMAGDPQQVFIDGVKLEQVQNHVDLTASRFKYDWQNKLMILGGDPTGTTVELSARPVAITAGTGSARALTVIGIGFRRYATIQKGGRNEAALYTSTYPVHVEACAFVDNAANGLRFNAPYNLTATNSLVIRRCVFAHNGLTGIAGMGGNNASLTNGPMVDNMVLEDCWFYRNNESRFGYSGLYAGEAAFKVVQVNGMICRRNVAEETFGSTGGTSGRGMWWDLNCEDVQAYHNVSRNNEGHGIWYEVSSFGTFAFNLAYGNGGTGIFVKSGDMFVWHNTAIDNGDSDFLVSEDERAPAFNVGGNTERVSFCNNVGANATVAPMLIRSPTTDPLTWETPYTVPPDFFDEFDGNVWWRSGGQDLIRWHDKTEGAGTEITYASSAAFTTARGLDANALDLTNFPTDPLFRSSPEDDFRLRSGVPANTYGLPLPVEVASLVGEETGASLPPGAGLSPSLPVDRLLAVEGPTDFNVRVNGVVLRVTHVAGTTSPQTFTVDATPVNGVTKVIPAGAQVRLARPWRLAF